MATGLSLVCGDCGAQLRSTKEAQDHAELTSHTNFVESTEAVLNLVCSTCGKPCRSKTETDLHTKRTGHTEFVDKTEEAAKPIELEAEKASGAGNDGGTPQEGVAPSGSEADATAGGALVVPTVNQEVKVELEAMGFSEGRATRALHFSGNTTVEAAVNWIVDHEEDPDIDELPMVPLGHETWKALTPEEARLKAQELREKARKNREEQEKKLEREREKERIRIGKELLEAKRMEEDQERKRIIELKRREKEEERKARERIRQRIEEDKAERRRKLGLPPEEPKKEEVEEKPAPMEIEPKKPSLPTRAANKAEQMRNLLRGLKQAHQEDDARVKRAFQTLLTFIGNVAQNPDEEKYRRIRLGNAAFQERVGGLQNGVAFLELCGFEKDETGENLVMARSKVDSVLLNTGGAELTSAMTNPFFGVLK